MRFGSYDIEGLTRAQREYVRDFVKLDEKHHGGERELNFAQLRDNLYSVLADGDFSMEFPRALYDSVSGRYTFRARFVTKPNFRLLVGGNVSSTAFNQAYIGATYRRIGRVAQSLGSTSTWGRSTRGARWGAAPTSTPGSPSSWTTPTTSRCRTTATARSAT